MANFDYSDNRYVYDVNHMTNTLEILKCSGEHCRLDQNGTRGIRVINS